MKRYAWIVLVGLAVATIPFALWWCRTEREAEA